MSDPDRPLPSCFDFSGVDADQLEAWFHAARLFSDRSLIGIQPCENNGPYNYYPNIPESSTGFPSSSQQCYTAPLNDLGDLHSNSRMVRTSHSPPSASSQPASHASRPTIPRITFNGPQASTAQLMLLIPNIAFSGQESPLSPGYLDTQSRSSGRELLSPVSSPSVEYTSSDSMDWEFSEDQSLDGSTEQNQTYTPGEEIHDPGVFQALQCQELYSSLVHRPRHPPLSEAFDNQGSLGDEGDGLYPPPVLPERSSVSPMHVDRPTFAFQTAEPRIRDDPPSHYEKNRRRQMTQEERREVHKMRKLRACIRCQVLRIKVGPFVCY